MKILLQWPIGCRQGFLPATFIVRAFHFLRPTILQQIKMAVPAGRPFVLFAAAIALSYADNECIADCVSRAGVIFAEARRMTSSSAGAKSSGGMPPPQHSQDRRRGPTRSGSTEGRARLWEHDDAALRLREGEVSGPRQKGQADRESVDQAEQGIHVGAMGHPRGVDQTDRREETKPRLIPKMRLLYERPIGRMAKHTNSSRQRVRMLEVCWSCVTIAIMNLIPEDGG